MKSVLQKNSFTAEKYKHYKQLQAAFEHQLKEQTLTLLEVEVEAHNRIKGFAKTESIHAGAFKKF
jgi:hypothetical protein